jgi:hypothetical protein
MQPYAQSPAMQSNGTMKLPFQIERAIANSHRTRRLPPFALLQAAVLALSLHTMAETEGPIYSVQDALKKEQIFFGERTGVLDTPTRSALRHFQSRHGLPETGEVDTNTLKALQSSTEANRPVIESRRAATKEPAPNPAIAARDRQFLENLEAKENAREQQVASSTEVPPAAVPPPSPARISESVQPPEAVAPSQRIVNPPPPPIAALEAEQPSSSSVAQASAGIPPAPDPAVQPPRKAAPQKREVSKSRVAEKPRQPARRKVEQAAQERRTEPRIPPASRVVEIEDEPEAFESGGVRVIRPARIIGPNGRTYLRITTDPATTAPDVRGLERVEPRQKRGGFFDRLFKDDGNDRENDDEEDQKDEDEDDD